MFVETKQEGETYTKEPSLRGLIAWLEAQPPAAEYNWMNCSGGCLIGKYLAAIGFEWYGGGSVKYLELGVGSPLISVARQQPYTFGAALNRARAAL
jgi:hypothetical protein